MDIKGKCAIVTGCSKGIGKYLALNLLAEGVKVAGWSRSKPDIDHSSFRFIQTDVKVEHEIIAAFQASLDFLGGRIDFLVNNAGMGIFRNLEDLTTTEWMEMFETNVHSIYYTCKQVVPVMKAQSSGHIVNIASIAALNGVPEAAAYCGTKFAVRGISQSLYREVNRFGIKVTCVDPGSVNTEFFAHFPSMKANDTMLNPDELSKVIIELMKTSPGFSPVELDVRPLNPKYS